MFFFSLFGLTSGSRFLWSESWFWACFARRLVLWFLYCETSCKLSRALVSVAWCLITGFFGLFRVNSTSIRQ
jgi:hypothetical protein